MDEGFTHFCRLETSVVVQDTEGELIEKKLRKPIELFRSASLREVLATSKLTNITTPVRVFRPVRGR